MHLKLQEEYLTRRDVQFCSVLFFFFANKKVMPFLCVTPSLPFTLNVSTISCACPWNLPRGRLQDFLPKILKCVLKRMAGRNRFTTLHKSGGWPPAWHWEFPSFHFWTILFGFAAAWCVASKMYFTEIWFGQVLIFGGFLANWFHPLYFAFSIVMHNYAKIFVTSASQML